ncbi:MAG: hypothetical protein ACR2ME_00575 [Acidimicrobiia bacterium]
MKRWIALLSLIVVACGANSTDPNTTVGGEDGPQMTIEGREFGSTPELSPGDSMTIVNLDSVRHTFSSGDDSWEAVEIAGNSEADFVAPDDLAADSYVFFCEVHSDMGGNLTIAG